MYYVEDILMKQQNTRRLQQVAAASPSMTESAEERVRRLYAHQGGPLIGWLWDEARRRGIELQEMAAQLGVTYGYVHQLHAGVRRTNSISHEFAAACGEFLGVPTVTVLLLAGSLTMSDFAVRVKSEEEVVERALRQMLDDSHIRSALPEDVLGLPFEAKRALTLMYAEATDRDVFGVQGLPNVVRWLQRAALEHDENEAAVIRGHRDVLERDE
jgi:transcriptional regulator with XRE-family HTH domain